MDVRHNLVSARGGHGSPLTTNVCITHRAALTIACMWCHFQQCPLEIGSVWAERVGQGEVGWCMHQPTSPWITILLWYIHSCKGQAAGSWPQWLKKKL